MCLLIAGESYYSQQGVLGNICLVKPKNRSDIQPVSHKKTYFVYKFILCDSCICINMLLTKKKKLKCFKYLLK